MPPIDPTEWEARGTGILQRSASQCTEGVAHTCVNNGFEGANGQQPACVICAEEEITKETSTLILSKSNLLLDFQVASYFHFVSNTDISQTLNLLLMLIYDEKKCRVSQSQTVLLSLSCSILFVFFREVGGAHKAYGILVP